MTMLNTTAQARRTRAIALATLALAFHAMLGSGQTARRDTSRTDSTRAQRLEGVTISAVRASDVAPISQKTIGRKEIEPRYFGQDVPLLLQGAAPSLTAHTETGTYWGYSYIRLRGLDQSRVNLTLDGIPLNDPEDQVLYFADFPDLANSLHSVQVQRGVGTSSNGTAAFAGSINMESTPLASTARGGEIQLEGGSFGSKRVSGEYSTGVGPSRFAAYARASALETEGYRYHSGVRGRSFFFSGGYFGDRDIVKVMATAGHMADTMAYLAVPAADLAKDRRINPLTPRERDGFGEQLAALSYTRLTGQASSFSATAYRISASGDYDVMVDSLWNFNLAFVWYGATSNWSYRTDALRLDVGLNANTYSRDHSAYVPPDRLYLNTGHKRDASGFVKAAYTFGGRTTLFGDVQARRAEFRYTPDERAGIAGRSISWAFLNPKAGITHQVSGSLAMFASIGSNTREPARSDMFAGFDNLDSTNVAFVGELSRVRPERVRDLEAGLTYRTRTFDARANLYSMDFRNEIAPIGMLSYIGTPLRKNVGASYRRGIEADIVYRAGADLVLRANASASASRIRQFTDSTGETPVTYSRVEPLLTPRFTTFERAEYAVWRGVSVAAEAQYTGRSFLQNTGDERFVLPAALTMNASASFRRGRGELVLRGNNLTDNKKYGSGYASGGVSYYYVVPPRNLFATLKLSF